MVGTRRGRDEVVVGVRGEMGREKGCESEEMVAVGGRRAEGGRDEVVVGVRHEMGREKGCEEAVFVVMATWRR